MNGLKYFLFEIAVKITDSFASFILLLQDRMKRGKF